MCSFDGCKKKAKIRGYCPYHYNKLLKEGVIQVVQNRYRGNALCSFEGCNRKVFAKGYCQHHYNKLLYNGTLLVKRNKSKNDGPCSFEGCSEEAVVKGFCKKHYEKEKFQTGKGREINRAANQARRARKKGAEYEKISPLNIFRRDNWVCGICGEPVDQSLKYPNPMSPSLDHIIPLVHGGNHTENNVQLAHLRCNLVKHDKLPEEL